MVRVGEMFGSDFNILKRIISNFDFTFRYTLRLPSKSFT